MSPDGANFLPKCFYGLGQDPCKILASQFFSVERCSSVKFAPYLRISNGSSADLRRAETLTFCMDTTLTPRNICAKNQRHLATFLLLSVKAENGYLLRWYTYESNFYTKMLLKGCRFQKYITCLRTLRFDTFRVLVQSVLRYFFVNCFEVIFHCLQSDEFFGTCMALIDFSVSFVHQSDMFFQCFGIFQHRITQFTFCGLVFMLCFNMPPE